MDVSAAIITNESQQVQQDASLPKKGHKMDANSSYEDITFLAIYIMAMGRSSLNELVQNKGMSELICKELPITIDNTNLLKTDMVFRDTLAGSDLPEQKPPVILNTITIGLKEIADNFNNPAQLGAMNILQHDIDEINLHLNSKIISGKELEPLLLRAHNNSPKLGVDIDSLSAGQENKNSPKATEYPNSTSIRDIIPHFKKDDNTSYHEVEIKIQMDRQLDNNVLSIEMNNDNDTNNALNSNNKINKTEISSSTTASNSNRIIEKDIVDQIVNGINKAVVSNKSEVNLELNPPSLGNIKMKIVVHNETINANINTENRYVKHLIEANIGYLKEGLENKGLKLGEVLCFANNTLFNGNEMFKKDHDERNWIKREIGKRIEINADNNHEVSAILTNPIKAILTPLNNVDILI